jgi:hypothetical protein
MSSKTATLLAETRALPPGELREFLRAAALLLSEPNTASRKTDEERVEWRDLSAWREQAFGGRETPNAVLEMREDARW